MVQPLRPKPSWKNLKEGFEKTPLREFAGTVKSWDEVPSNFGGKNIHLDFIQLQVLATDAPYPYAEETLEVKLSEAVNSGWGILGKSFAVALGIAMDDLDIDLLMGRRFHMLREDNHPFGKDKNTGQGLFGTVWQCIKMLQPGEVPTPIGVAPVLPLPTPTPAAVPTAMPASAAPAIPVPLSPVALNAEEQALFLADGKNMSDFFAAALSDQTVKGDADLVNRIINRTFVEGMKEKGRLVENPDGTMTKVK